MSTCLGYTRYISRREIYRYIYREYNCRVKLDDPRLYPLSDAPHTTHTNSKSQNSRIRLARSRSAAPAASVARIHYAPLLSFTQYSDVSTTYRRTRRKKKKEEKCFERYESVQMLYLIVMWIVLFVITRFTHIGIGTARTRLATEGLATNGLYSTFTAFSPNTILPR